METAKVDVRRLQLLNDRINQCIDALTQVRLSVHGLSSGFGQQQGFPQQFGQQGFGPQFGPPQVFGQPGIQGLQPQGLPAYFAQQPIPYPMAQGIGFGAVPPFVQNPLSQLGSLGLSHTSGFGVGSPFTAQSPWASQQQGLSQQIPFLSPILGLSHTSPDELYARSPLSDPILASRIGQTFPYVTLAFPPALLY